MSKILIGIPTMQYVAQQFLGSTLAMNYDHNQYCYDIKANSLVYIARNEIAVDAIGGGFDWLVFLDSDMVLEPDTVSKLVHDAREFDHDFVTGLYFKRKLPTEPLILKHLGWTVDDNGIAKSEAEVYTDYPKNKMVEIAGSGMGCCIIKVDTLHKVANAFRCGPFDPMQQLSEDYAFCWRMRQYRRKLWCDTSIKAGHAGTYVYTEEDYERGDK